MSLVRRTVVTLSLTGVLAAAGCSGGSTGTASSSSGTSGAASTSTSTSSSGSTSTSSSGSASASGSGSASSSASSSATPGPTPKYPAAARKNTKAGAEAFAGYFWDWVNYSWATPRSGAITSLSDKKKCDQCMKLEDMAKILVKLDRRYSGAPFTIDSATRTKVLSNLALVRVEGSQNKVDVLAKDGAVLNSQAEGKIAWLMLLSWSGKRWDVQTLTRG